MSHVSRENEFRWERFPNTRPKPFRPSKDDSKFVLYNGDVVCATITFGGTGPSNWFSSINTIDKCCSINGFMQRYSLTISDAVNNIRTLYAKNDLYVPNIPCELLDGISKYYVSRTL